MLNLCNGDIGRPFQRVFSFNNSLSCYYNFGRVTLVKRSYVLITQSDHKWVPIKAPTNRCSAGPVVLGTNVWPHAHNDRHHKRCGGILGNCYNTISNLKRWRVPSFLPLNFFFLIPIPREFCCHTCSLLWWGMAWRGNGVSKIPRCQRFWILNCQSNC